VAKQARKGRRDTVVTGERLKGETVPPINIVQLMQSMRVKDVADHIGTSSTTLHKAVKHGYVSKSLEVAAGGILRELKAGTPPAGARLTPYGLDLMRSGSPKPHAIGGTPEPPAGAFATYVVRVPIAERHEFEKFATQLFSAKISQMGDRQAA